MSDHWLEHGHGMDGSDLTPVFSSSSVFAEGAATAPTPTWTSGWRAVVIGGGVALLATLGVAGMANAISDNLFPSMGSTSPASVWQNPVPPAEPAPISLVVPSTAPPTTTPSTTAPPATTPSSVPTTSPTSTPSSPSSRAVVSPGGSVATSVSPTTSAPDQNDDSLDDDSVDDDVLDDDSSGSGGSGSGSDDSGSSGRSGSDDRGSDDSDDG